MSRMVKQFIKLGAFLATSGGFPTEEGVEGGIFRATPEQFKEVHAIIKEIYRLADNDSNERAILEQLSNAGVTIMHISLGPRLTQRLMNLDLLIADEPLTEKEVIS